MATCGKSAGGHNNINMGRELKRVPLDFDWPTDKLWPGYINDLGGPCPKDGKTCFGGYTAAAKWLDAVSRLILMLGEEAASAPYAEEMKSRGRIFPHPYLEEWGTAPRTELSREAHRRIQDSGTNWQTRSAQFHMEMAANPPKLLPLTPELVQLVSGLTGGLLQGLGGGDAYHVDQALRKAAGVPEEWGRCPACDGHGDDPKKREAAEAWERKGPPIGDGFQLWTSTSEGAPISPVFATMDELCGWCETNATTFASFKTTAAEWKKMLEADNVHHAEGSNIFI